jgi:RNA polymerase sigma-70 factor (ECF subfamily)
MRNDYLYGKEKVKKKFEEGEISNFEDIVRRYEKMVYGIVYRFLNNHQDAEDITQETFLIVYRKLKSLRKASSLTNWIYTITLNLVRENLRKKYRIKTLNNLNENLIFYNDGSNLSEEIKEKIKMAIEKLPEKQKEVINLKFIEGLKIKEISKIMECKEGTVKTHIFRGLRTLRRILKNERM